MKIRLISVFIVVTLLITGIVWCQAQTTLGDVNGDGKINAADALLILKHSVGKIKLKEEAKQAADTTGSHNLSAKDALCVLQKAVGSIRHFPVEITEVGFNKWNSGDEDNKHFFATKYGTNNYIGWATLCNTYEEYLAFLDSSMIQYNLLYELEGQKQEFAALYSPVYSENNSLLLFTVKPGNSVRRAYVNRIYTAGRELNVAVEIIQPGWGPFDVRRKLYRVELHTKTQAITNLHFEARYREQDPFSTADLIDVRVPYDFKLK